MKLHAKDDDNEYLHTADIKSYWYENEKKGKSLLPLCGKRLISSS